MTLTEQNTHTHIMFRNVALSFISKWIGSDSYTNPTRSNGNRIPNNR